MKVKVILALALLALLVVLLAQNTQVVVFRIWFWTVSLSQVILVPLLVLAGFLLGFIVGTMGRRKKEAGPS